MFPANAENDWYGESPAPVGLSGRICHHVCFMAARASTHLNASGPRSPMPNGPGRLVGWRRMPDERTKTGAVMAGVALGARGFAILGEYGNRASGVRESGEKMAEPPKLVEGVDYYVEAGRWVFTAKFLRDRGYCCDSGCRHCPYRGAEPKGGNAGRDDGRCG